LIVVVVVHPMIIVKKTNLFYCFPFSTSNHITNSIEKLKKSNISIWFKQKKCHRLSIKSNIQHAVYTKYILFSKSL